VSSVPVINATIPPQALLDLYTIYRSRPLGGLSVAKIGELDKGGSARSLAYLLAKFERVRIFFVSPPELRMRSDILQYLDRRAPSKSTRPWMTIPGPCISSAANGLYMRMALLTRLLDRD
jgi:aspartate carbamoyltransferase catalytic subunit